MKERNFNQIVGLAFSLLCLCAGQLLAQTNVNMAANGSTVGSPFTIAPPANCYFNFYDSGGQDNNYSNNTDANVTFAPSNPATHRVQARFTMFSLEVGWDAFYIYNSNTVGTNQLTGPNGVTGTLFPAGNWQSQSPGIITANTGIAAVGVNAAEALTFRFRSDGSNPFPGWAAIVSQIPIVACAMTAPAAMTVTTGAASTTCFAAVTTPLPTFSPGGCNTSYQLQYRINGGAATIITTNGFTSIQAPKGTNVISWELVDPCGLGLIASATQIITVNDDTPPILNCPSNVTLTLVDGLCSQSYNYTVTCTDNCPFPGIGTITHPIDFDNGDAGVMFDVVNLSPLPITLSQFGPSLDAGTWPMEVYYTTSASTWQGNATNSAAWTLAGTQTVTSTGPGAGTAVNGFGILLYPGQSMGIYLTSKTGQPMNYTGTGAGIARQFDDGKLRVASNPGAGKGYPFAATFTSRAYNGYVNYQTTQMPGTQLLGLQSGAFFPLGETLNTFRCTDASGNTATCSFKVTVIDNPNPILSLTCNDLLTIALGDGCFTTIGADDILEGGGYRCYSIYVLELDKTAPFGNGPWVPAQVGAADIGKTYRIRVTDPITGNKCFGDVKIQDNVPPKLVCPPITTLLPCSFPTDPAFSKVANATLRYGASNLPASLVDFQTREFIIPVDAPAGATVNDVDFRTKISGDGFNSNLRMQIESPSGTIVNVWNQVGGCFGSTILVRLDDEGASLVACPNYTMDKRAQIPFGVGSLSSFDGQPANGNWKIRISDLNGFNDVCNIEIAELYVNVAANFSAGFPNGLTLPPLTAINANTYSVPAGLMDDCTAVTLSYSDVVTQNNCNTDYFSTIKRRWLARDAAGNTAVCIQTINTIRPTLADVVFPPNYDGIAAPAFDCLANVFPTVDWITAQGLIGTPLVFGVPNSCILDIESEDQTVWVCDGSYNIRRTWNVVDPCAGVIITHQQLIRVQDTQAPTIQPQANITVTTDPFACCGTVPLPKAMISDGCSRISGISAQIEIVDQFNQSITDVYNVTGNLTTFPGNNLSIPDTLGVLGNSPCLPAGTHIITYTAVDDCGNTGTVSFTVTVSDFSPPVPTCTEQTTVAIGLDDPQDCYTTSANGCEFGGVTWVRAKSFDQGSYDNCSAIKFTIRRNMPYSPCILALNPLNGHPNCNDGVADAVSEFDLATNEGDSIKFYCCEVGTVQEVTLRVYQLDYDGNIAMYPDGTQIYNECTIKVQVQDKLKPACEPPLNVTVSCENFDPSLWSYGKAVVYDNCCLDSTKSYQGMKGLTHSVNYSQFDTVCNKGTIIRTFRSFDCHGFSSQCTQRVIVNYTQDYFIKFPDDKILTTCDGTGTFGQPEFYGENCELLGVSYSDELFTVVPDACYKLERTWKVINWCTYNPQGTCIVIPNPTPNSNSSSALNLPGPTVSKSGTIGAWAPSSIRVNPTDANLTNYATFWDNGQNANANCYVYKQIIKVIDAQKPVINCPASPVQFCDLTPNNPQLWNELYWFDGANQSHDLCEGLADLSISATDACSGANINIRYLLFLDLDQNGTMETVVNSANLPDANVVRYDNANTANYLGGINRGFDERPVPLGDKYRFALQTTKVGNNLTGSVRWNTLQNQGNYTIPELPYGTHKIKWIVSDGCGNESTCEYTFVIKDCKAPTVVCINGLSANVMPTGITLYTSDFLLQAVDNCTLLDYLKFGIRKSGTGTGFPLLANGMPQTSVTFFCNEVGTQPVELWAIDAAGNADYCETYIIIQDNLGNCPNSTGMATVAGALKTEMNLGLEEAGVEIAGQNPAGPDFSRVGMTTLDGTYKFNNAVPLFANLTVTPTKDDNHINGVSTFDLVLISKHILGIEPLGTPYKIIAADVNRSGSITTYDIVELRKLVLGVYTELPNNTSWRFVDKGFTFPNPENPWQTPFPENKTVAQLQASAMDENFVAVKVGDINGNAVANSLLTTEDRSTGTLLFDVTDRAVAAGDDIVVQFDAAQAVAGYQFTLNYTDLQVLEVTPGEHMGNENFAVLPGDKAITTSWDGKGKGTFAVKFHATKAGQLSAMLAVSSRITKAEAYTVAEASKGMDKLDVAFRFNSENGSTISGVGFELYQNQPNPFVNKTMVGFHLPESTEATLRIFDESGRQVYAQKGDYAKGYNTITIERALLNTSGMLYYTLETEHDSATRKMIQMK